MSAEVYPIQLGVARCFVVRDKGAILIDGGAAGKFADFEKGMAKIPVDPKEIQLIIVTHGHWDHIGSVRDIQDLTGAKVAMHGRERDWLEGGQPPLPPGLSLWGRLFGKLLAILPAAGEIRTSTVDIELDENGLSLDEFGVSGRIIPTPGHTHGSVSVLLESGTAFVGDLAMNMFPMRLSPGLPIFGDDMELVKQSWKKLLQLGVRTVYPGHGNPFSADVIKEAIA